MFFFYVPVFVFCIIYGSLQLNNNFEQLFGIPSGLKYMRVGMRILLIMCPHHLTQCQPHHRASVLSLPGVEVSVLKEDQTKPFWLLFLV